ncbi:hypothetical protein M9H77_03185 [Catharanthus roseus]|uniref:Uncharacterized protein n=1 Tax=Catharanthus roseus TaxID=4058 RepID=A0ACC0CAT1_CATRO|nr:hypothetical protein M9H77_03185 [Catharanthus roseus]
MENREETNIVLFVDVEDLNYGIFNSSTCIDVDSMIPKSVEKEFTGKEWGTIAAFPRMNTTTNIKNGPLKIGLPWDQPQFRALPNSPLDSRTPPQSMMRCLRRPIGPHPPRSTPLFKWIHSPEFESPTPSKESLVWGTSHVQCNPLMLPNTSRNQNRHLGRNEIWY